MLYLQLPQGVASCVTCHGPDPAAGRNNLLRAADQPQLLLKGLGAIGAMGYLKSQLSDTDIDDLAAYLGDVARLAASTTVHAWPRTVEFGVLDPGAAAPPAVLRWRNLSTSVVPAPRPRLRKGLLGLSHDCGETLAPGGTCTARILALAGTEGAVSDVVELGEPPLAPVPLSMVVRPGGVGRLVVDPPAERVEWGDLGLGQAGSRSFELVNAGTAAVTLGVATLTGPGAPAFALTGCAASTNLPPGGRCRFQVQASPGAAVTYDAHLAWRSDGTNPEPLTLRVTGQAPATAPPPPPAGTGGGGCAAGPAGRPGDLSLLALLGLALAGLAGRRRAT